ncbi:MAG: vitamin K epoxide reductase family protein [Acidimicrobiales bacterium]
MSGRSAARRRTNRDTATRQRAKNQPGTARAGYRPAAATRPRTRDVLQGRSWRPLAIAAICLAGIGISIYLLIVHYDHSALICSNSGAVNCFKVLTSPASVIFGVPVPVFGLIFFVGMGVICSPFAWRFDAAWLAWGRIAAAVAGIGMVVYFVYQEALVLHTLCLWCTGVHVLTFAMFLIIITGWEDTGYARSRYED